SAALLAGLALRPLGVIIHQLDVLTAASGDPPSLPEASKEDAIERVSQRIDVLGRQMRSSAEEFSTLQSNFNQLLDTLRDCVVLFSADRRAILVSEPTADPLGAQLD